MLSRFLSLFAVLVLVAACSTKPEDTGSITTDGDTLASSESQATPVDQNALGTAQAGTQQDLVVNIGDRVFFAYDQFDLSTEARGVVERQAQWLKTYPAVTVIIEGHCDERGTIEYNVALGERRANTVKAHLVSLGIPSDRLSTISYGEEKPLVTGDSESVWTKNRRANFVPLQ